MMTYRNIASVSKKESRINLESAIEDFFIKGGTIKKCRVATASGVKKQFMKTKLRTGKNGYEKETGLEFRCVAVGIGCRK